MFLPSTERFHQVWRWRAFAIFAQQTYQMVGAQAHLGCFCERCRCYLITVSFGAKLQPLSKPGYLIAGDWRGFITHRDVSVWVSDKRLFFISYFLMNRDAIQGFYGRLHGKEQLTCLIFINTGQAQPKHPLTDKKAQKMRLNILPAIYATQKCPCPRGVNQPHIIVHALA